MNAKTLLILATIAALPLGAQTPLAHLPAGDTLHRPTPVAAAFHGCPAAGHASLPHPGSHPYDRDLDTRKNRIDQPAAYIPATAEAVLELPSPNLGMAPRARWPTLAGDAAMPVLAYEGLPVTIEGYLAVDDRYPRREYGVTEEGAESTNCDAPTHAADVHLWLTPQPNQDMTHAIVAELTPRVREMLGQDSSSVQAKKLVTAARRGLRIRVSGWVLFDEDHPEQLHDQIEQDGRLLRQRRATLWEIHPALVVEVLDGDGQWHDLAAWNPGASGGP